MSRPLLELSLKFDRRGILETGIRIGPLASSVDQNGPVPRLLHPRPVTAQGRRMLP